jgi:hypothetical protein
MHQDNNAPRAPRKLALAPVLAIVAVVALAIYFLIGSPDAPFRLKPASGTAQAMSLASDNDAPTTNQTR